MYGSTRIYLYVFAATLLIGGFGWTSVTGVETAQSLNYFDDFSTEKAQNDSYEHSVFWPEGAFSPNKPHLYYASIQGNPPRSLVFMDYWGIPAHLNYRFGMNSAYANARVNGTVSFDVGFPLYMHGGYLAYSLSTNGKDWTNPAALSSGHHNIGVTSMEGNVYVAFWGRRVWIDNLAVHLSSPAADILVPGSSNATIQDAIDIAANGAIIEVGPGTYSGPGNWDIDFNGKAITLRSAQGPSQTIIDCRATGGDMSRHRGFYFHGGENSDSVLRGFTILGGQVEDGQIPADGEPWISDTTLPIGAGIFCDFSSPTIIDCVVSGCGGRLGGGIGISGGGPTIIGCTVENCHAGGVGPVAAAGGYGGAIGIIRDSDVRILRCIIRDNTASEGSQGGGIYCRDSEVLLWNSEIYHNGSSGVGNVAVGGGVYCGPMSDVTLQNCVVSSNAAVTGGGIFSESDDSFVNSSILVQNCTVAHNSNGGIESVSSDIHVKNSIVWYNAPFQLQLVNPPAESPVVYSNIEGGWPNFGAGNIMDDPHFANVDTATGSSRVDYHLSSRGGRYDPNTGLWVRDLAQSPCIDAGDPGDAVGQEPNPHGDCINMGAYGGTWQASKSVSCRVFHVSKYLGADTNGGESRWSAFATIQQAIEAADDCDMILVWPGVYTEAINFIGHDYSCRHVSLTNSRTKSSELLVFRVLTHKPGIGSVRYCNHVTMMHSTSPARVRLGLKMTTDVLWAELF